LNNTTIIFVMSDSHGNTDLVNQCLIQADIIKPNLIYHLGDYYNDADVIISKGYPCVRVPGTWTSYYQDFRIENRRTEIVHGWRFYLTHTPTKHYNDLPDDSDPEAIISQQQADVVFHGHTHRYCIDEKNNVIIMNPGHCKAPYDKGYCATYGVIKASPETLSLAIYELFSGRKILDKIVSSRSRNKDCG